MKLFPPGKDPLQQRWFVEKVTASRMFRAMHRQVHFVRERRRVSKSNKARNAATDTHLVWTSGKEKSHMARDLHKNRRKLVQVFFFPGLAWKCA